MNLLLIKAVFWLEFIWVIDFTQPFSNVFFFKKNFLLTLGMLHNKAFDETNPEKDEFRKEWDKLIRLNTKSDE